MDSVSIPAILSLSFALGLFHALDADHIMAVSVLSAKNRLSQNRQAVAARTLGYCLKWAIGHGGMLLAIGLLPLTTGYRLSATITMMAEKAIGLLLIGLGAWLVWKVLSGGIHFHFHRHGSVHHIHLNEETNAAHPHQPVLVGMIHGVAGGASVLALIPVLGASNPSIQQWVGISYLLLFSLGVLVSMMVFGLFFGQLQTWLTRFGSRVYRITRLMVGFFVDGVRSLLVGPVVTMRQESEERIGPLRSGYTTGACATATSLAAAKLLLSGQISQHIEIYLPRGEQVRFRLTECSIAQDGLGYASTVKDGGDDPDATHGATVFAKVALPDRSGIRLHAAEGVGTVTNEGLSIPVGEPAINPVPRQMIHEHLQALAKTMDYRGGFEVHIGIKDGEKIALKTMNGRLGIVGGLSILGTTGIVRPFSCAAYIASIHQGIDVAYANGATRIAAVTGSTSERYVQQVLNFDDMAIVEMGDFAGAVFKHLRKVPIRKMALCGGFGKLSKLAAGHTSLHSKNSSIDFRFIAEIAQRLGAESALLEHIRGCNTSLQALALSQEQGIPVADEISRMAGETARANVKRMIEVDVYCLNKSGQLVGTALSGT